MAEDIKGLIEKIQQEGIQAAQDKARKIEEEAHLRASEIIKRAKEESAKIIRQAEEKSKNIDQATRESLKQASRDALLSLRREIERMLQKVVSTSVTDALSVQELGKMILALIHDYKGKEHADIIISLNKHDLQKMEKGLLGELKEEIKKGIILKPSDEIVAGFTISFDSSKSHFDFTDKALSSYLGSFLKSKLADILED